MLTIDRVRATVRACLFDNTISREEMEEKAVRASGVMAQFGFDPDKLEQHKLQIRELLDELPEIFESGYSFLELCFDRHGRLWTSSHLHCDELLCLGLAAGYIEYCLEDRSQWEVFHGGLPYVRVSGKERENAS